MARVDSLEVEACVRGMMRRFRDDVAARLRKLSRGTGGRPHAAGAAAPAAG